MNLSCLPVQPRPGEILRLDAAGVADPFGLSIGPASLLAHGDASGQLRILAVGAPREIDQHEAATHARKRFDYTDHVILPGLVNAHAHLDLTHIGPRPFDRTGGFVEWIDMVRTNRHLDQAAIAASVVRGIELALAGGTVAIGDIAGAPRGMSTLTPWQTLRDSPLWGVSFIEFFGMGRKHGPAHDRIEAFVKEHRQTLSMAPLHSRIGLQPHAPNTVDLDVYRWAGQTAMESDLIVSTHLAETAAEHEFVARGTGPQREFLERLGLWDASILEHIGHGRTPVEHLFDGNLENSPSMLAHVNDASDRDIQLIAQSHSAVVYCPRASEYFGAETVFGPHRYRDMLAAGIPVALGTDSIINLEPAAASPSQGGISILDEMRRLYRRDRVDPDTLLRMATWHGGGALWLSEDDFAIRERATPLGLIAVQIDRAGDERLLDANPMARVLQSTRRATLLYIKKKS